MSFSKKGTRQARYCRWISAMLLIASAFSAYAGNIELEIDATEISLNAHDADLREILELLAERADFDLWISSYVTTKPVNLSIRSGSLETVLRKLLAEESHALVLDSKAQTPRVKGVFVLPAGTAEAKGNRPADLPDQSQTLEVSRNAQKFIDQINALKLRPAEDNGTERDDALITGGNQGPPKLMEQIEKLRLRPTGDPLKQNENSSNMQDNIARKIQTLSDAMNADKK